MSPVAAVANTVCSLHDRLVEDCETARDQWNERRAEIAGVGLRGKGIDDELRSLQARFARSYAMVRNHLRDCDRCQSARGVDDCSGNQGDVCFISSFRFSLDSDSPTASV